VSEQERRIVTEPCGEPHIAGRRLTVRRIGALTEKRSLTPATIAERFDLPLADIHHALAFYYDHPELMHERDMRRQSRTEATRAQSLTPGDVGATPEGGDDPENDE